MNAKKCKLIRKLIRIHGADPKYAAYTNGAPPQYIKCSGIDSDGKLMFEPPLLFFVKVRKGIPTKLDACGRAIYKKAKKIVGGK